MAWSKLDDALGDHPKTLEAGNEAFGVYVRSILYCSKQLTDGHLPASWPELACGKRARAITELLLEVGFWEQTAEGFYVHDYLDHNPTRELVLDQRKSAAERQAKARASRNGHSHVTA